MILLFSGAGLTSQSSDRKSFTFFSESQVTFEVVDYDNSGPELKVKKVWLARSEANDILQSKHLSVEGLEGDLVPINGGCYCYPATSQRFVILNVLFFAHRAIENFNRPVTKILGHPIRHLDVHVYIDDRNAPRGEALGDGNLRLWLGKKNFDPSVLIHEIAHEVHAELLGQTEIEITEEYRPLLTKKLYAEFVGIFEAVANLLTSIELRDSVMGRIAWVDIPMPMDVDVQYERLPSQWDFLARISQSKLFSKRYAMTTNFIRRRMDEPQAQELKFFSDPYLSSPILVRPLAQEIISTASPRFAILLSALREARNFSSYSDFVSDLLTGISSRDEAWAEFLRSEFAKRGIVRN